MSMVRAVEQELPEGAQVYGLAIFNGEVIAATSFGTFVRGADKEWRLVEPAAWVPVTIEARPAPYYVINPPQA
jgi:hypothetical protein